MVTKTGNPAAEARRSPACRISPRALAALQWPLLTELQVVRRGISMTDDMDENTPQSHPFDTEAPSISRRALDHEVLLSGDYWGELRTFLWVAKAGSLSRAAELLGSSHATVGREIRRLQDQMGSQLVILTKNGANLTQKGRALTAELLRLDQRL